MVIEKKKEKWIGKIKTKLIKLWQRKTSEIVDCFFLFFFYKEWEYWKKRSYMKRETKQLLGSCVIYHEDLRAILGVIRFKKNNCFLIRILCHFLYFLFKSNIIYKLLWEKKSSQIFLTSPSNWSNSILAILTRASKLCSKFSVERIFRRQLDKWWRLSYHHC